MAFKLSKDMKKRRDEISAELATKKEILLDAIMDYNKTLEDARDFLNNDVVGHFNDEFSDKSDNWQEGDRGEAVRSWIDEIENAANDFDDLDGIDDETLQGHIDALDNIEDEPSY